ncbi:unnamed protein product [Peronospora belbahrii]|uniref:TAF1C beta-propeller domain-containing protein n=1 Tax=Peronospora belbahrii TaxID=622444 RepID=A0AAU9KVK7_9STRA|nr:unnamed protein product [Peronospora belbahrii]CAH0517855.1 unnamed protein product [Peronospora belbahrii]
MEATSIYPNSTPLLATNGLGITLAGSDPDHVSLEPDLINDPRRRYTQDSAVDAIGVMRLHVRNALGYAFLRPYHIARLRSAKSGNRFVKEAKWKTQASFYRHNYRHFVPHDLMMEFLENECPIQEDGQNISKWQGNAIAGVDRGHDGHVIFYPTGQVLQQVCAWYSKGETNEGPPCSSTVIETGAVIRQLSVMGSKDAYHSASSSKIFAAARGCTNCTIIAAPARVTPDKMRKLQAKAKISLTEMINHVAGSPHAEAEVALVTADGMVRWWDPEGGIRFANKDVNIPDRLLRCEYSSHPRVLLAVNRVVVAALDLRQPAQHASKLFDLAGTGTYITIYDVKRRASNPFHFVVGTGVSVELVDSRMARQSLVSWVQPESYSGKAEISFGAIDEVDISRNASDLRGYIVSSSKRPKVTTLFPFERNRKRRRGKALSLTLLRSNGDDEFSEMSRTCTEQLVASDATLDLHMEDGGEYTNLTGICALRNDNSASATIYQLNSLGDVLSHQVSFGRSSTKSYHAAVQADLPCGVTAQAHTVCKRVARTLPIPLDAILPEYDTESMQRFTTFPIKVLRRQFPRLPENKEIEFKGNVTAAYSRRTNKSITEVSKAIAANINRNCRQSLDNNGNMKTGGTGEQSRKMYTESCGEDTDDEMDAVISVKCRSQSFDKDELVSLLANVCNPSTSLFRLHRYVLDELKIELTSSELLQLLRSSSKLRIRTVHHTFPADTFRVRNPSLLGADAVHCKKDDPRLATCACYPGLSRSQLPCMSWACVIPHMVIVSRTSTELQLDDTAPSSAPRQKMPVDLADIIVAAQAVYDDMHASP